MASNSIISDENRNKRKKELKNEASENLQSSPKKMDLSLSERFKSVHKTEDLEKVLNDTSKEINTLLSKYAHILSERAAMDASYVEELEGILKEASSVEYNLKLKRENLRHRFAAIAGPLQNENELSGK